jgi:hypothetical protein
MSQHAVGFTRRQLMRLLGTSGIATGLALAPVRASAATTTAAPPTDSVSDTYYRVLLSHTRWSEEQWDAAQGHYTAQDFGFAVVLGNAVLLTRGPYDAERAGVDQDTLRARTVATVRHFAASNRLTGGTEWGRTLFFDTTFQSYFVLAARLLWDDLDEATRRNVDTIVREQAQYTAQLGTGDDPASAGWTPHGLSGGFQGDTKLEEMGVYAQSLAPGLAWAGDDPRYEAWRAAFGRWSRNEAGLPAADLANPARVDGISVSANTAQNLYDTFIVENHGSFGPHYQEELWRTSARNSAHFLLAGRALPEVLTAQPNAGPLWRTLLGVMSDAGEPLMPMVADREHLYGRDVIPLAFLAQVLGDRTAARCELALAERLEAYQAYPPQYRLAKFSGEPKYEPEARAELAISYLLHEWRARSGKPPVRPMSPRELFEHASGVTDHGSGPGLVSHQSPGAWSGAVSKSGFVKFAWQPAHDDWLFAIGGTTRCSCRAPARRSPGGRSSRTHGCGTASTAARPCSPWTTGMRGSPRCRPAPSCTRRPERRTARATWRSATWPCPGCRAWTGAVRIGPPREARRSRPETMPARPPARASTNSPFPAARSAVCACSGCVPTRRTVIRCSPSRFVTVCQDLTWRGRSGSRPRPRPSIRAGNPRSPSTVTPPVAGRCRARTVHGRTVGSRSTWARPGTWTG